MAWRVLKGGRADPGFFPCSLSGITVIMISVSPVVDLVLAPSRNKSACRSRDSFFVLCAGEQ